VLTIYRTTNGSVATEALGSAATATGLPYSLAVNGN